MTRDVRKEFVGHISAFKEKQDSAGGDQASAQVQPVDPNIHGMKWMKECQPSYRDVQLEFWLLLRPLTDGGEESSHWLACRLLSVWHWSSAVRAPSHTPLHPTSMNISYWLWENSREDERQLWIEAYACGLQCVAEASVGRRWITERGIKVPKVSRLVEIFLNATEHASIPRHNPVMLARTVWKHMPVQNLEGIRQSIVCAG